MKKTDNPERDFNATPKKFSKFSKIIGKEKKDVRQGVVLDNRDEFARALLVYDGKTDEGATAAQDVVLDDVERKGGSLGLGLALVIGQKNAESFTERLTKLIFSEIESKGKFDDKIEYGGLGTNFFKAIIKAKKVGEKYILDIISSSDSYERESQYKFAEVLKKPIALVSSDVKCRLSIVDDWWFNINLEDILKDLLIPKRELKNVGKLTEYIAASVHYNKPEFDFKHKGKKFNLEIDLNCSRWVGPEKREDGYRYLEARGNILVGPAWDYRERMGPYEAPPKIGQPSIVFSITYPGYTDSRPVAVTPEQMTELQEARDYITDFIRVYKEKKSRK